MKPFVHPTDTWSLLASADSWSSQIYSKNWNLKVHWWRVCDTPAAYGTCLSFGVLWLFVYAFSDIRVQDRIWTCLSVKIMIGPVCNLDSNPLSHWPAVCIYRWMLRLENQEKGFFLVHGTVVWTAAGNSPVPTENSSSMLVNDWCSQYLFNGITISYVRPVSDATVSIDEVNWDESFYLCSF